MADNLVNITHLINDIKSLINDSKIKIAIKVNTEMTLLYWHIGEHINNHILNNQRGKYGKQIVATVSRQLQEEFGNKSWSEKDLWRMMQFASNFPNIEIVATLSRQLTWSHFRELIPIEDNIKRNFYIEIAKLEHWSVRTLRNKIQSMLFERTSISRKPNETITKDLEQLSNSNLMSCDLVFRDPYMLNFLNLHDTFSEKDLESAIITELQQFISEIGLDFAFMARQKRITIDNEDYYIDLLFYHRRLKCLVAIDLKLGDFKAAYKGQMELYLRWLEKYETIEGENKPIGLILCAGKNEEHIELLHLNESNIRVAEYITQLPRRDILEKKLQLAIQNAKSKFIMDNNYD